MSNFDFNKILGEVGGSMTPPADLGVQPGANPAPTTPAAKTPESIITNVLSTLDSAQTVGSATPGTVTGTVPVESNPGTVVPTAAEIAKGFTASKSPQDLIFESIAASRGVSVEDLTTAIMGNPNILAGLTGGTPVPPVVETPAPINNPAMDLSELKDPAAISIIKQMQADHEAKMAVIMKNQAELTAKNNLLESEHQSNKATTAVHTFVEDLITNVGVPAESASEFLTSVGFDTNKLNDAAYVNIVKELAKSRFPSMTPATPATPIASNDSSITGNPASAQEFNYDAIDKILKDNGM